MRTKRLNCGCCGSNFRTWDWYQDQDQDKGYGICKSCQWLAEDNYIEDIEKGFELIFQNLTWLNKEKARKMLFPAREALVLQAREDWVLSYKIS